MTAQYEGGARVRADGKGDSWANAHRLALGRGKYMMDVDGLIGIMGFAANTGEHLFLEYEPDSFENHGSVIREFSTVAMFDRKTTEAYALCDSNRRSFAWYLNICRRLSSTQCRPVRFFFVIGESVSPWTMIEIDISTGNEIGQRATLEGPETWTAFWNTAGLFALRKMLADELMLHP
jgi:hypothetical protein